MYSYPLDYLWISPKGAEVYLPCRNCSSGVDLEKKKKKKDTVEEENKLRVIQNPREL